jgi:hypothetical protein
MLGAMRRMRDWDEGRGGGRSGEGPTIACAEREARGQRFPFEIDRRLKSHRCLPQRDCGPLCHSGATSGRYICLVVSSHNSYLEVPATYNVLYFQQSLDLPPACTRLSNLFRLSDNMYKVRR